MKMLLWKNSQKKAWRTLIIYWRGLRKGILKLKNKRSQSSGKNSIYYFKVKVLQMWDMEKRQNKLFLTTLNHLRLIRRKISQKNPHQNLIYQIWVLQKRYKKLKLTRNQKSKSQKSKSFNKFLYSSLRIYSNQHSLHNNNSFSHLTTLMLLQICILNSRSFNKIIISFTFSSSSSKYNKSISFSSLHSDRCRSQTHLIFLCQTTSLEVSLLNYLTPIPTI